MANSECDDAAVIAHNAAATQAAAPPPTGAGSVTLVGCAFFRSLVNRGRRF